MKRIKHHIKGNNFHGNYHVVVIGPEDGFELSDSQIRKIQTALCSVADCKCNGGYGDGPDSDSAVTEEIGPDRWWLHPARKGE